MHQINKSELRCRDRWLGELQFMEIWELWFDWVSAWSIVEVNRPIGSSALIWSIGIPAGERRTKCCFSVFKASWEKLYSAFLNLFPYPSTDLCLPFSVCTTYKSCLKLPLGIFHLYWTVNSRQERGKAWSSSLGHRASAVWRTVARSTSGQKWRSATAQDFELPLIFHHYRSEQKADSNSRAVTMVVLWVRRKIREQLNVSLHLQPVQLLCNSETCQPCQTVEALSSPSVNAGNVVCCPMLHRFPAAAEGPGNEWVLQRGWMQIGTDTHRKHQTCGQRVLHNTAASLPAHA